MELEAGAAERARELLQKALAAKDTREALKICEDFEMQVGPRLLPAGPPPSSCRLPGAAGSGVLPPRPHRTPWLARTACRGHPLAGV